MPVLISLTLAPTPMHKLSLSLSLPPLSLSPFLPLTAPFLSLPPAQPPSTSYLAKPLVLWAVTDVHVRLAVRSTVSLRADTRVPVDHVFAGGQVLAWVAGTLVNVLAYTIARHPTGLAN